MARQEINDGKAKSHLPFDNGTGQRALAVARGISGAALGDIVFHRNANDRRPPREVVTAKLLGDPPPDLEARRANPGARLTPAPRPRR